MARGQREIGVRRPQTRIRHRRPPSATTASASWSRRSAPTSGETVRRIGQRHTIALFPFVDGHAGRFGRYEDAAERAAVVEMLAELHRATPAVASVAREIGLEVPGRRQIEAGLRELNQTWSGGPFSERARRALAAHASDVAELLALADRLAADVAGRRGEWVVTHGEPHAANVMRTGESHVLVDWDTVALAPPERDLWIERGPAVIVTIAPRATRSHSSRGPSGRSPRTGSVPAICTYARERDDRDLEGGRGCLSAVLPERRTEPDRKLRDAHAEAARREVVPTLVDHHQHRKPEDGDQGVRNRHGASLAHETRPCAHGHAKAAAECDVGARIGCALGPRGSEWGFRGLALAGRVSTAACVEFAGAVGAARTETRRCRGRGSRPGDVRSPRGLHVTGEDRDKPARDHRRREPRRAIARRPCKAARRRRFVRDALDPRKRSTQVAVYLAGVPLRGGANPTLDLATLPLWPGARVRVYRSFAPAAMERGSLGGTLVLGIRLRRDPHRSEVWTAAGSFGSGRMRVGDVRGTGDGVRIATGISTSRSDDDFTYLDPLASTSGHDVYTTRENAGHAAANSLVSIALPVRLGAEEPAR